MYIEFAGTPGAGKTTIARELKPLLESSGFRVSYTRDAFAAVSGKKLVKLSAFALNIFRIEARALYYICLWSASRRSGFKKAMRRIYEYAMLKRAIARAKGSSAVIWDSGMVQWFANLAIYGISDAKAAASFIARVLPVQSLLVFVELEPDESRKRIMEREEAILRKSSAAVSVNRNFIGTADLSVIRQVQKGIIDNLANMGFKTMVIDGLDSARGNAEAICRRIMEKKLK